MWKTNAVNKCDRKKTEDNYRKNAFFTNNENNILTFSKFPKTLDLF